MIALFLNKFLISTYNIDFISTLQFNKDWIRINVNNELIIINSETTQKLFGVQIACFLDSEVSEVDFVKVFNFDLQLNHNSTFKYDDSLQEMIKSEPIKVDFKTEISNDIERELTNSTILIENDTLIIDLRIFSYIKDLLSKYLRDNNIKERLDIIEKQIQIFSIQLNSHFKNKNIIINQEDCKVLLYSIFELSSKEIAILLNKSPRTIQNIKYGIRKKLGLSRDQQLKEFIDLEIK